MIYNVTDIEYDTEDSSQLPTELSIQVDDSLSNYDRLEFISEEITNITEYCHTGFSTTPSLHNN
jgi:hypothetical protein